MIFVFNTDWKRVNDLTRLALTFTVRNFKWLLRRFNDKLLLFSALLFLLSGNNLCIFDWWRLPSLINLHSFVSRFPAHSKDFFIDWINDIFLKTSHREMITSLYMLIKVLYGNMAHITYWMIRYWNLDILILVFFFIKLIKLIWQGWIMLELFSIKSFEMLCDNYVFIFIEISKISFVCNQMAMRIYVNPQFIVVNLTIL